MSVQRIPAAVRAMIAERAAYCCEYCRMPNDAGFAPHEPDHIIAENGAVPKLDTWICATR